MTSFNLILLKIFGQHVLTLPQLVRKWTGHTRWAATYLLKNSPQQTRVRGL